MALLSLVLQRLLVYQISCKYRFLGYRLTAYIQSIIDRHSMVRDSTFDSESCSHPTRSALETIQVAFDMRGLYWALVINFGNFSALMVMRWCVSPELTFLALLTVFILLREDSVCLATDVDS